MFKTSEKAITISAMEAVSNAVNMQQRKSDPGTSQAVLRALNNQTQPKQGASTKEHKSNRCFINFCTAASQIFPLLPVLLRRKVVRVPFHALLDLGSCGDEGYTMSNNIEV